MWEAVVDQIPEESPVPEVIPVDQSIRAFAGSAVRRDALRSLGGAGMALLAALGVSTAADAKKGDKGSGKTHKTHKSNGTHKTHKTHNAGGTGGTDGPQGPDGADPGDGAPDDKGASGGDAQKSTARDVQAEGKKKKKGPT